MRESADIESSASGGTLSAEEAEAEHLILRENGICNSVVVKMEKCDNLLLKKRHRRRPAKQREDKDNRTRIRPAVKIGKPQNKSKDAWKAFKSHDFRFAETFATKLEAEMFVRSQNLSLKSDSETISAQDGSMHLFFCCVKKKTCFRMATPPDALAGIERCILWYRLKHDRCDCIKTPYLHSLQERYANSDFEPNFDFESELDFKKRSSNGQHKAPRGHLGPVVIGTARAPRNGNLDREYSAPSPPHNLGVKFDYGVPYEGWSWRPPADVDETPVLVDESDLADCPSELYKTLKIDNKEFKVIKGHSEEEGANSKFGGEKIKSDPLDYFIPKCSFANEGDGLPQTETVEKVEEKIISYIRRLDSYENPVPLAFIAKFYERVLPSIYGKGLMDSGANFESFCQRYKLKHEYQ